MDEKITKIKALIERIKKDCVELEKEGTLTQRGRGHFDVVQMIETILNQNY